MYSDKKSVAYISLLVTFLCLSISWKALTGGLVSVVKQTQSIARRFSEKREIDDLEAERIIETYLMHRAKGRSITEIAEDVFDVHLSCPLPTGCHSTYPFLNRGTLLAYADVAMMNDTDPAKYEPEGRRFCDGDVIFLKTHFVRFFVEKLLPGMNTRFIVITHFSDSSAPMPDPDSRKGVPPIYSSDATHDQQDARPNLVHAAFSLHSNRIERTRAREMFAGVVTTSHVGEKGKLPKDKYFELMLKSKFVLSPPGAGIDCLRTYEALFLGAIPIVKNSSLYPTYSQIPCLVLDDWWEPPINDTALREMLLGFKPRAGPGRKLLMAQYWFDKIDALRRKALETEY